MKRLNKAEEFFERHGGKVVLVARFVELLRQLNGIAAGIAGMRWRRFLAFNALGVALWVVFWEGLGYFFRDKFGVISDKLGEWGFTIVFFLGPFLMVELAQPTTSCIRDVKEINARRSERLYSKSLCPVGRGTSQHPPFGKGTSNEGTDPSFRLVVYWGNVYNLKVLEKEASMIWRIIASVLLPPLGAFLAVGVRGQFWLNIVLTLLGHIPGVVHAVWLNVREG